MGRKIATRKSLGGAAGQREGLPATQGGLPHHLDLLEVMLASMHGSRLRERGKSAHKGAMNARVHLAPVARARPGHSLLLLARH